MSRVPVEGTVPAAALAVQLQPGYKGLIVFRSNYGEPEISMVGATGNNGTVELPVTNTSGTGTLSGEFSSGGNVIYNVYNRNDVVIDGERQQDQWGTPENVAMHFNSAVDYSMRTGNAINIGDLSTPSGDSPFIRAGGNRHGTHFNGAVADWRYPNANQPDSPGNYNRAFLNQTQSFINSAYNQGARVFRLASGLSGNITHPTTGETINANGFFGQGNERLKVVFSGHEDHGHSGASEQNRTQWLND